MQSKVQSSQINLKPTLLRNKKYIKLFPLAEMLATPILVLPINKIYFKNKNAEIVFHQIILMPKI